MSGGGNREGGWKMYKIKRGEKYVCVRERERGGGVQDLFRGEKLELLSRQQEMRGNRLSPKSRILCLLSELKWHCIQGLIAKEMRAYLSG